MDHDRLFKELLRVCFVDFLELFLPEVLRYLDVKSLEFIEQESFSEITKDQKRSVDLLVKARFRGKPTYFLIHVEVQADKRGWSGKRMFYYFAVQTYKHDLPVYPIAIFSWDNPRAPEQGQYAVEFPDRRVLEFNFAVIQLNRLDWRDFLKRDNPAASALMAKMGVRPEDRPKVRAACLGMIVRLKLPEKKRRPILRFIDAYLPLSAAQKEEFKQEIKRFRPKERKDAMEYITSWEREGIEKGRVEGRLEGKVEAAIFLLTQQIGQISDATTKRISRLSPEKIDALLKTLLNFKSKADLDRWLRTHAQVRQEVKLKTRLVKG
ncbi:MAG: Rpn family recombination-promoting nuclease/putative transposase [Blastocatellia bacterium]